MRRLRNTIFVSRKYVRNARVPTGCDSRSCTATRRNVLIRRINISLRVVVHESVVHLRESRPVGTRHYIPNWEHIEIVRTLPLEIWNAFFFYNYNATCFREKERWFMLRWEIIMQSAMYRLKYDLTEHMLLVDFYAANCYKKMRQPLVKRASLLSIRVSSAIEQFIIIIHDECGTIQS